jgi:hypothetical protein
VRNFRGRHLEIDELVGTAQCVAKGVVHLELTVRVFMVDLVDVEATRLGAFHQLVKEGRAARQSLVVVAGLVERVRRVEGRDCAVAVPPEQHELRLDAGVQRQALRGQAIQLALQDDTRTVRPG